VGGGGASAWSAGLAASYEADLFGRVSAAVAAARADADAQQAVLRDLQLVLQADVAQTYLRLRALDAELATLERNAQLWAEHVGLTERRVQLGDAGEFDLARARTELSNARGDALAVRTERARAEHALALLIGRAAPGFTQPAAPLQAELVLPQVPAGVPARLLERRPDIAAAGSAVQAAQARIGVARATLLPDLTLQASGDGRGPNVGDLFGGAGRTAWLLRALLAVPLFDGGRRHAAIAQSEAVYDEVAAAWRARVLEAATEVEDSLAAVRLLEQRHAEAGDAVRAARRAAELAELLYRSGRTGYLELLDARRNLARAERLAAQVNGSRAAASVALIRALGGGWDAA
jgi:multidrug efflux system outer membrane protein